MAITRSQWLKYVQKMSRINKTAAKLMQNYINIHGFVDNETLIDYAYALASKYGEASAAMSAEMYDLTARLEGMNVPEAIPADTATFEDTAKAVNGSLKKSPSGQLVSFAVERLVKQAGEDTTLQNAKRDGAYFAWIPNGDTCAFCITLASRGWQRASQKTLKGDHAEHIHQNCDCSFSITFKPNEEHAGYDPEKYRTIYRNASDGSPQDKINALRRQNYKKNKDSILAGQREAYAKRTQLAKKLQSVELTERQESFILKIENNPKVLGSYTPSNLKIELENMKFDVKPLGKGDLKQLDYKDGGGYCIHYRGDGYLQYHPEGHHHKIPYYKISSAKHGVRRYDTNGDELDE